MYNNRIDTENKWIIYRKTWRIILKPMMMQSDILPTLAGCNFCVANEAFVHADRVLPFHVLIYVVSGCIYVTEEDQDYEIEAGSCLILHSGIRHYGKKLTKKGTSWYYAHFYLKEPEEAASDRKRDVSVAEPEFYRASLELPKVAKGFEQKKLARMFEELIESIHAEKTVLWYVNTRLFALLSELAMENLPSMAEHSLSDQIADYLSEHLTENFSASALEETFFLSYKHMSAVFKKEKKMTMQQYHTKMRIGKACQLLCMTMKTIGEISEELGYHDMLYFSRCFHQTIGMSPTGYRRQQTLNY